MARDAELPAREFLELALRHAPREREIGALERVLAQAQVAINLYGEPSGRDLGADRLAATALDQARRAEAGGDHQLAWIRTFSSVARSSDDLDHVRGLLDGSFGIPGLAVDTELRWHIVQALASAGGPGTDELIAAERRRDPTDLGERYEAAAMAARPTSEAKKTAWDRLLDDRSLTVAMGGAIMRGFQQPGQEGLLEPYAARYIEELGKVWEERDFEFALAFGEQMFPRWAVSEETVELVDRALENAGLSGPMRRLLLEGKDRLLRAIRARRVDAQSATR
jgi:aminopeptidase N